MAKRRTNPALYELIQARQGSRAAPLTADPKPVTAAAPTTGESIGWFSPGRTIRLPIGYLFLAAAGLILLAVSAYMFGYQHGERATELQFGDLAGRTDGIPSAQIAQDPMATDARVGGGSPRSATYGPVRRSSTGSMVTNADPWGPVPSNPREIGLNYFILIHTHFENAVKLAKFCRKESLEAYVVKAKNIDQYQVIFLPGYRKGARETEQIRALERRIKAVTQKWKLRINPRDDLSYYPDRYDG